MTPQVADGKVLIRQAVAKMRQNKWQNIAIRSKIGQEKTVADVSEPQEAQIMMSLGGRSPGSPGHRRYCRLAQASGRIAARFQGDGQKPEYRRGDVLHLGQVSLVSQIHDSGAAGWPDDAG